MDASFASSFGGFQRHIAYQLGIAGLVVALVAGPAVADTPEGVSMDRIVTEIRELKRLVFQLKQDERKARAERSQVVEQRGNALQYANGGRHVLHLAGFVALVQRCEQSPGQASLWQMQVPRLNADNFVPQPEKSFAGGDVSQLVHYCRQRHLSVRLGSRAQLIVANLACDAVRQADSQIAELDERIEHYKTQNVAHTDLVGRLMLCAQHCRSCHACYHHGYGSCGGVPRLALDHPIAGLNSRAYDTNRAPKNDSLRSSGGVATDQRRLKFLTQDEPTDVVPTTAANQIAGTKDRPRSPKTNELPSK